MIVQHRYGIDENPDNRRRFEYWFAFSDILAMEDMEVVTADDGGDKV